jgi:hypothetical protein
MRLANMAGGAEYSSFVGCHFHMCKTKKAYLCAVWAVHQSVPRSEAAL